jgi:hypothetical protein
MTATLAGDLTSGTYTASSGMIWPCPGNRSTRDFTAPAVTASVRGKIDSRTYPSSANISLTLTQKQILRTGAAKANSLLSQAQVELNNDPTNTPALRTRFAQILEDADGSLEDSRKRYSDSMIPKAKADGVNASSVNQPNAPSASEPIVPVIFEDLHLRYQAAIIELRVRVTPETSQQDDVKPRLVLTQLSKRDPIDQKLKPPTFARAKPLWAIAALILLKDHVDGFNRLADGGLDVFTFDLDSAPDGATVFYTRLGQSIKQYGGVTPLRGKTLPLAHWTFTFKKDGCTDFIVEVDAVEDPSPHPYGDFSCKTKRNSR